MEIMPLMREYMQSESMGTRVEVIQKICDYFYRNRSFYRKALKIEGQNCFSEHFRECIRSILKIQLEQIMGDNADEFALDFLQMQLPVHWSGGCWIKTAFLQNSSSQS